MQWSALLAHSSAHNSNSSISNSHAPNPPLVAKKSIPSLTSIESTLELPSAVHALLCGCLGPPSQILSNVLSALRTRLDWSPAGGGPGLYSAPMVWNT